MATRITEPGNFLDLLVARGATVVERPAAQETEVRCLLNFLVALRTVAASSRGGLLLLGSVSVW